MKTTFAHLPLPGFVALLCVAQLGAVEILAQDTLRPGTPAKGMYALAGIGPSIPLGNYGDERTSGFDLNTAVEYRFSHGLLIRGMFDFASFSFGRGTISQTTNGQTYDLSGSNNVISLAASAGYSFPLGRFSLYGFAGPGITWVSLPRIEVDEAANTLDSEMEAQGYLSLVGGAGLDFLLNPYKGEQNDEKRRTPFFLYAEAFYTHLPETTATSRFTFNSLAINLGIKSKF